MLSSQKYKTFSLSTPEYKNIVNLKKRQSVANQYNSNLQHELHSKSDIKAKSSDAGYARKLEISDYWLVKASAYFSFEDNREKRQALCLHRQSQT